MNCRRLEHVAGEVPFSTQARIIYQEAPLAACQRITTLLSENLRSVSERVLLGIQEGV